MNQKVSIKHHVLIEISEMSSIILDPQPRIHQIAQSLIFQQLDLSGRFQQKTIPRWKSTRNGKIYPYGCQFYGKPLENPMENPIHIWKILWKIDDFFWKSTSLRFLDPPFISPERELMLRFHSVFFILLMNCRTSKYASKKRAREFFYEPIPTSTSHILQYLLLKPWLGVKSHVFIHFEWVFLCHLCFFFWVLALPSFRFAEKGNDHGTSSSSSSPAPFPQLSAR